MSDFKFLCPVCGQRISGDTGYQGAQIACPSCQTTITVPMHVPPPPLPTTVTLVPSVGASRTSGLAIASLICSLSSFITGIGWLPGIICGHMAKARIRRDPSLGGKGLATAGLIIGYGIITISVAVAASIILFFSAGFKQAYDKAQSTLMTNQIATPPVAQAQTESVSNDVPETTSTNAGPMASTEAGWTLNVKDAEYPDSPVSGKLHGVEYNNGKASFRNGELKFTFTNHGLVSVHGLGASIENRSLEFQTASGEDAPQIEIKWSEGSGIKSDKFASGYAMKLKFDKAVKRKIHGQVYLCLPDDAKSYIAGEFQVTLPKKKP